MKYLMKSKGFTLIEMLVSLVILAVSLLALAGLMSITTKNNSFGGHITEAATFAQDKLEEFRALRPQPPPEGDIPEGQGSDQRIGATGINYTRNWNVQSLGNIRLITITITWNDRINHSIALRSVISL